MVVVARWVVTEAAWARVAEKVRATPVAVIGAAGRKVAPAAD